MLHSHPDTSHCKQRGQSCNRCLCWFLQWNIYIDSRTCISPWQLKWFIFYEWFWYVKQY